MTKYYELTKYPNIFKNTYWGDFFINNCNNDNNIFTNRNEFVEKYNIKKNVSISDIPNYIYKEFENLGSARDHIECYLTNDNKYILVSSPYNNYNNNIYHDNGFLSYEKLYNSAYTYIKIINNKSKKKSSKLNISSFYSF